MVDEQERLFETCEIDTDFDVSLSDLGMNIFKPSLSLMQETTKQEKKKMKV